MLDYSLLLDYELLNKLWIHDIEATMYFPFKLKTILQQALEVETFVVCHFESSPPEWIILRVEPAKQLIRIDIDGMPGYNDKFENNMLDPELDWLTESPPETQLRHLRATVQGNFWLWDKYYDPHEYCLEGKTYNEKIYWPKTMGTIFIPFQYTTRHSGLVEVYKKKHEEWIAGMTRGVANEALWS